MGLYSETDKTARLIFASLAIMTVIVQLSPAFSEELTAASTSLNKKSTGPITSQIATQQSAPAFAARIGNISPASGTWNRTPSRSAGLWTSSQVASRKQSNIRFASASGIDESVTSPVEISTPQEANTPTQPADESLAAAAETNATSDQSSPPAPSSISAKEQLLNALRMQREAITNPNSLKPTKPPGSLTIMNSPTVTQKSPSESTKLATPLSSATSSSKSPTSTNQKGKSAEIDDSTMQPKPSKSFAGLTQTLEEELNSDDTYLRERAQRFLRLQKQLLQLRSRQAAAAETATQNVTHNTGDNSIPVNPGNTATATQSLAPSRNLNLGSNDGTSDQNNAEQQSSDDSTLTQNFNAPNVSNSDQLTQPKENNADETMSNESHQARLERSAIASLLDNVVVDGPIDRLGLANNLFAVKQYPLALEMYEQTTGPELSSQQQLWAEYQTATCLRHLGNPAEASNRYRKLASQPEHGWLSQQAHWWVETSESIRILEKALKDHSIEQCREVIENVEAATVESPVEDTATTRVSEALKSLEPANDEHTN